MPYRGVCSAGGTGWACRYFEQGLLWPAITGSMKVRSSSVSRSQGRALPSVLGTTLPCEEPETRNKGSSSHVAKAVCHGNIREPLVGRLLQLLRAWFPPSPRSLSLLHDYVPPGKHKENTWLQSLLGSIHLSQRGLSS